MTYFISAIWHGIYPGNLFGLNLLSYSISPFIYFIGFFIFFMSLPLLTEIERLIRSKINPLLVPTYNGYDVKTYPWNFVGTTYWILCWIGMLFYSVSLQRSFECLNQFSIALFFYSLNLLKSITIKYSFY